MDYFAYASNLEPRARCGSAAERQTQIQRRPAELQADLHRLGAGMARRES